MLKGSGLEPEKVFFGLLRTNKDQKEKIGFSAVGPCLVKPGVFVRLGNGPVARFSKEFLFLFGGDAEPGQRLQKKEEYDNDGKLDHVTRMGP